jgi:hypothetical protein
MIHVPLEDFDGALALSGRPPEERKRAHHLKSNLPLLRVGKHADEEPLVWLDPVGSFVRQFFQQVGRPQRHQPIGVLGEGRELLHLLGCATHELEHSTRPCQRSPVAA